MIYINPQWQGSGFNDDVKVGAEVIGSYLQNLETVTIPLSNQDLTTVDYIKCFKPILQQAKAFKDIVIKHQPKRISTIGGDCGVELIPISYLNNLYKGDLAIIWIDAHADLNTPESSPSKTFHGMPLRTLLGEGNAQLKDLLFSTIAAEQICFVGLRDLDKPEADYISHHEITSLPSTDLDVINKAVGSYKNIYIHLDLDVLDKSEYPFTMFPTSNGLLVSEVANLIKQLKREYNVVGLCITESIATSREQLKSIKPILDEIELSA